MTAIYIPRMWEGLLDKSGEEREKELIRKTSRILQIGQEAFDKEEARKAQIRKEFDAKLKQLRGEELKK